MRIIEKPWGKEEVIEINTQYMVKKLTMFKGHRCSLQYHEKKTETIYVLSGELNIYLGDHKDNLSCRTYYPGDSITISNFQIHRMEGKTDSVYLEASTPEMDDVIRLKDDYKR